MKCKCGSHAINHGIHGRDGSDGDLCDVCYWRKRACTRHELQATGSHQAPCAKFCELKADAMRYRYLRDTNATRFDGDLDSAPAGIVDTIFITEGHGCSSGADPDELDAAIDAAIAKQEVV